MSQLAVFADRWHAFEQSRSRLRVELDCSHHLIAEHAARRERAVPASSPPGGAPSLPLTEAALQIPRGAFEGFLGWSHALPGREGVAEHRGAVSSVDGLIRGVPALGVHRGVVGVDLLQQVAVEPELAAHLLIEFLFRWVAGLQVGDNPALRVSVLVKVGYQ